jgi:cellulose synthase/poly-beta-1,6-N-acetylglucosamine synthase-like glycosyltransferase
VLVQAHGLSEAPPTVRALLAAKMTLEALFSFFLICNLLKTLEYLLERRPETDDLGPDRGTEPHPPTAILYLCCGDLDEEALLSLARLRSNAEVGLFVHDDEGRGVPTLRVREAVRRTEALSGRKITLLSRPVREGGKAGAVNHALSRVPERFELLLLADSDSRAASPDAWRRAFPLFRDPRVGAVQFRNRCARLEGASPLVRSVAKAIDVFDVFASHQSRHGYLPFLGHNGLLRTEALRRVGGLTPGMLSDDIDLSIRLSLAGYRIEYAPEVVFEEMIPPNYLAFRARAGKWAVGCAQVIRRHLGTILWTRRLTPGQKIGLLEFAGFYLLQVLLLAYLVLAYIALPLLWPSQPLRPLPAFLAGSAVVLAVLAPALVQRGSRGLSRLGFAWQCALAYGSLAVPTLRGVCRGLVLGEAEWVPTTRAGGTVRWPRTLLPELAFGAALFAMPLAFQPILLVMPSTYLFVANFLFVPLVAVTYRSIRMPPAPDLQGRLTVAATAVVALLCVAVATGMAGSAGPAPDGQARVAAADGALVVDGRRFPVKGIHYSPYPPGTGPDHGGWPGDDLIASDLGILAELGANTLLVHDAPVEFLDRARDAGFMVIHTFTVNWQSILDEGEFEAVRREIGAEVARRAGHPAMLYYCLGNEIPEWLLKDPGTQFFERRLEELARTVRGSDPRALVSHANWPPAKSLHLPFLDVVSFNLYPAWPREVAVAGYGPYIESVLRPLAGRRPLVITEFGQNSLEADDARQADLLRSCWREIRVRAAGGVVFAFADEWWKNYDNPIPGEGYWMREFAPADHLTHDLDPEEHYGILTAERVPKPAYQVVRQMFRADDAAPVAAGLYLGRWVFLLCFALVILYTLYVFSPFWRRSR